MKQNKDRFLIFRVSKEEKNLIEKRTIEDGFKKISDYLRDKLGL